MMKITILTDNRNSWIIPFVEKLKIKLNNYSVSHVFSQDKVTGGDIMLILSCENIISEKILSLHKNNIVVHPSDLPKGKGWSPLAWQVIEGKGTIPITLFEASKEIDAGDIYTQDVISLDGTELNEDIKKKQGLKTIEMISKYIQKPNKGIKQNGEATFYKKRMPSDSELNINKSISEQFNLLRVVDNERYPAFFRIRGKKYIIKIYDEK
jgi:methionyl-tRNA formyltransferase